MSQDHYLDTRKVFSKETIASMSDKDLGLYVFGVFVAHVAAETDSTFESVSQKFTNDPNCLETETIDSVAFASTLRFAARGEPQKAGSLFRADLAKGALSLATLDEVISGRRKQKKTQKPQRSNRVAHNRRADVSEQPQLCVQMGIRAYRRRSGQSCCFSIKRFVAIANACQEVHNNVLHYFIQTNARDPKLQHPEPKARRRHRLGHV